MNTTTAAPSPPTPAPAPRDTAPAPTDHPPPSAAGDRPGRVRRGLRVLAVVSCLPYIVLKVAWIAGSSVGIPQGSPLLDPDNRLALVAANGLTVFMDAAVVVLALAFTQPWGRRLPGWLLLVPAWIAAGLLAPIAIAFPVQMLLTPFSGAETSSSSGTEEPFLADWVFGLVYGGFLVQALALGALFVTYAAGRWGALLRGPLLPPAPGASPLRSLTAGGCAVLAVLLATVHLLWAAGVDIGLSESRIDGRGRDFSVAEATHALYCLSLAAGVSVLAGLFGRAGRWPATTRGRDAAGPTGGRRGRRVRQWLPLTAAWVGSAAVAAWGGWLLMAGLAMDGDGTATTAVTHLTYAGQVTIGTLTLLVCSHLLAERAAHARQHRA